MEPEQKIPVIEHLTELRDRLIHSFIAVALGFVIAYFFKEKIFTLLTAPLVNVMKETQKGQMIFTGLPEAFFVYLKVSLLAGIVLALPVLFYEFWMFVAPGLYRREKKYLLPAIGLSIIFFCLGACFGYFVVFPYGFAFFLGFATDTIQAMPSMKEYLSFASKMLLAFGFVFELPLILTLMARMGLVTASFLKKNRKYALWLCPLFYYMKSAYWERGYLAVPLCQTRTDAPGLWGMITFEKSLIPCYGNTPITQMNQYEP